MLADLPHHDSRPVVVEVFADDAPRPRVPLECETRSQQLEIGDRVGPDGRTASVHAFESQRHAALEDIEEQHPLVVHEVTGDRRELA